MRVLHLLPSLAYGGGPQHVLTLAKGMRDLDIECVVGGPDGPMREQFEAVGVAVVPWGAAGRAGHDLVHSHGKKAGLYGRWMGWVQQTPSVHTFHGLHYEGYGLVRRRAYFALERWLARRTAAIIHLTDAQAAEAKRVGLLGGHVIPNGIDVEEVERAALARESARAVLGLPMDAYVLGTIARLDPVKKIERLIAAMTHLPEAHLVIIGDGSERGVLEAVTKARSLGDRVHFLGAMPNAATYLRAFDVFVSASTREGLPLALLEAMACGLPVLVSDIPAHRAVLGDSPQVSDDIVRAAATWLRDSRIAPAWGASNRDLAARFDARSMVEQTAAVYAAASDPRQQRELSTFCTKSRPWPRPLTARRGELPKPEWD